MGSKNVIRTTPNFWVCVIGKEFFIGEGTRTAGKCGWKRKCDLVQSFKYSKIWREQVTTLQKKYPDKVDRWGWKNRREGVKLEKEHLAKLEKQGLVKFVEIKIM